MLAFPVVVNASKVHLPVMKKSVASKLDTHDTSGTSYILNVGIK